MTAHLFCTQEAWWQITLLIFCFLLIQLHIYHYIHTYIYIYTCHIYAINVFYLSWEIIIFREFCGVHYHSLCTEKLSSSPHYKAIANIFLTHNSIWKMASMQWLSLRGIPKHHLAQLPSLKSHQVGQLVQLFIHDEKIFLNLLLSGWNNSSSLSLFLCVSHKSRGKEHSSGRNTCRHYFS